MIVITIAIIVIIIGSVCGLGCDDAVNPGLANDAGVLPAAMAHLPALTSLSLASTAMVGCRGAFLCCIRCLRLCVPCCHDSRSVSLAASCTNDASLMQVAQGLRFAMRLRGLDLHNDGAARITTAGVTALASALHDLSHLESLNLRGMISHMLVSRRAYAHGPPAWF